MSDRKKTFLYTKLAQMKRTKLRKKARLVTLATLITDKETSRKP